MSIIFTAFLALLSCGEQDPAIGTDNYTIRFETDVKNIDQDSREPVTVGVITEDLKWGVRFRDEADKQWLIAAADALSSTVRLQARSENTEMEMRTAVIEAYTESGNSTAALTVNQYGTGHVLKADKDNVVVERKGGEFSITLTANIEFDITKPDWIQLLQTRALEDNEIKFSVPENNTGSVLEGSIEFKSKNISPELKAVVAISQKSNLDMDVPEDIRFRIASARALNNEYQPGSGIELSIDDKPSTNYHSRWGGSTVFPVQLEYDMPASADRVDYIVYLSPPEGNGVFGEVELWANTRSNGTFVKLLDFDCGMQAGSHPIIIPGGIESPRTFRFVVKSGGAGVVTCAEMYFYKYSEENADLADLVKKVFKTPACMELNTGYTEKDLVILPETLSSIARELEKGTYPKEFRCGVYAPYTDPVVWKRLNKTKAFSPLDNPMGIEVEADKKFYVLVGDLHGNTVTLLNVTDGFISGEQYVLREGINEFSPNEAGQLYVKYVVDDLTAATAKPIEIHIPVSDGTHVFGYFDLAKHKTAAELQRLLELPDPIAGEGTFPVLGKRIQWNFLKSSLLTNNTASGILEALLIWDDMIGWFWKALGIDDPQSPSRSNNRQLAISSVEGYYMFATDHYVHFSAASVPERINKSTMFRLRDLMWGPAHEFGHQLDTGITWHGQFESSNNLFSNIAIWYFSQLYDSPAITYGPGLWAMTKYVFEQKKNFMEFELEDNGQGEYVYDDPGMFLKARMYWLLYVYYHIVGKDPQFFPKLFAYMRTHDQLDDPQAQSMQFYKDMCDMAQMDFTEFFQCFGWFNPIDMVITQYGEKRHLLTSEMVDEAQAYVKAKGYPQAPPVQYIDDRVEMDWETEKWAPIGDVGYYKTYVDDLKVSPGIRYSKSGDIITITDGGNAVGYEIRDGHGALVWISVYHEFTTDKLTGGNKLYAVQADGARIEIAEG